MDSSGAGALHFAVAFAAMVVVLNVMQRRSGTGGGSDAERFVRRARACLKREGSPLARLQYASDAAANLDLALEMGAEPGTVRPLLERARALQKQTIGQIVKNLG